MFFNRKYYKLCFIVYMFINTLALGYLGVGVNLGDLNYWI